MLVNIIGIFQNIYHVDLHFMQRESSFCTPCTCFFSVEVYLETFKTSKMVCFCLPVNDFKPVNCVRKNSPS